MKKKFVQIAALCLSAALLAAAGGRHTASAVSSGASGEVIRVGLHYGSDAMEGLNLGNETGEGFRFGYYDSSNQFVLLGSTGETAISVVKTANVWYGYYNGYRSYHSKVESSSVAVGEYYLQLPGAYSSFAKARAAAARHEGGYPAYIGGEYFVRIGSYTTRDKAEAAQTALLEQGVETELKEPSAYGVNVVVTGESTMVFHFDDLGKGTGLGIEPNGLVDWEDDEEDGAGDGEANGGPENEADGAQDGGTGAARARAADSVMYTTWSKNVLYPGGFRFERIGGGNMTVVNMVGLEDYVEGVIATEMSDGWPAEALKAQAVAARSYAVSLGTKHSSYHFDICDEVHCQAYTGQTRTGSGTRAAVVQTAGQVVFYNNKVAEAFYYSSNGGASESSSIVWGSPQSDYPYLVGKADPYEAAYGVRNDYTKTVSSGTLAAGLKKLGYNGVGSSIVSVAIVSLTDAGNPKQVTFTDNNGKRFTLDTRYVKDMLGLSSFRYGLEPSAQPQPPSPAGVSVNGSSTVDSAGPLYAIDGSGNVASVTGEVYVITGKGTVRLEQDNTEDDSPSGGGVGSLGSTTGSNGSFTFVGKGWGHNVGMSQYGARAMAEQGYTYQQILQFYYTDITVGYM